MSIRVLGRSLLILFFCGVLCPLLAIFGEPNLSDLIASSDLVCVGKVTTRTETERRGTVVFVKADIAADEVLKGEAPKDGKIRVFSVETDPKKSDNVEDPIPAFPAQASKVLLFLRRDADGTFVPVSPRSGLYKIGAGNQFEPPTDFILSQVVERCATPSTGLKGK